MTGKFTNRGHRPPRAEAPQPQRSQNKVEGQTSVTLTNRYLYWLFFVFPIVLAVAFQYYFWLDQGTNYTFDEVWKNILFWLKFLFLIPLFSVSLNFLGLIQGHPPDKKVSNDGDWFWDEKVLLLVSYVSKGANQKALKRSIQITQDILNSMNVKYEIEIVTDIEVPIENRIPAKNGSIYYHLVPQSYETNTKVKYKARALQYRLEQRTFRLNNDKKINLHHSEVWTLHLDEESIITPQAIIGIKDFIKKYSLTKSNGAIGQGEILYNAYDYGRNIILTSIDSIRTGDDLGRFRFQYKVLNKPVTGMHGSYVLMPALIEKAIGWDLGSKSTLTEDTYFGFKAIEKNIKFDWLNGFIKEQSPFSIKDIFKQRMRWYNGLSLIISDNSLKLQTRIILIILMMSWTVGWIPSIVFIANPIVMLLINKSLFSFWTIMIISYIIGINGSTYMIGLLRNLSHLKSSLSGWRKLYIILVTYILWFFQILSLIESAAVLYSIYRIIFRPLTEFPIVAKD